MIGTPVSFIICTYACTHVHYLLSASISCKMMRCLSDLFSSMTYHLEYSLPQWSCIFVQWLTYYASRDWNYECYKHSIMNILDFEIKAPSAVLMTDCRRDFHVCLCAIVSMCISAHTIQYPTNSRAHRLWGWHQCSLCFLACSMALCCLWWLWLNRAHVVLIPFQFLVFKNDQIKAPKICRNLFLLRYIYTLIIQSIEDKV